MEQDGYKPELREASIVALGNFNPAIFQPQWYAANGLIRLEEAENAKIGVIHDEFTAFSAEWFRVEVMQGRFALFTEDPTKNLPLRDLAVGTFKILEHTPIRAFGFNLNQDFAMSSSDEWHAIGDHYAPKQSWSGLLMSPGLRLLVMEGMREGSDAKRVSIRLEPSTKLTPHGVRISINEHYDLDPEASPQNRMRRYLDILGTTWEPFLKYADRAGERLLREAKKDTK